MYTCTAENDVGTSEASLLLVIQDIKGYSRACGGELYGTFGAFASPNYPADYANNMNCTWTIQGPRDSPLILRFVEFNTEATHDKVVIRNGTQSGSVVAEINGSKTSAQTFTVNRGRIFIRFTTDVSVVKKGFLATWHQ